MACLLSGGIDSPVAAWRMMRRGCRVLFVHFHSYPILSRASQEKARELAKLLTRFQYHSRLFLVPFGEIQQRVVLAVPPPLRVVVYRRLMMRIAERIARMHRAQGLVTGDVVGQVASQTLENMATIGSVVTLPVLRPLVGHGQGRNHRRGDAPRHLSDLDHSGPGLLHAFYAAAPGDQGEAAARSSAPKPTCRSTRSWRRRWLPPRSSTSAFPIDKMNVSHVFGGATS